MSVYILGKLFVRPTEMIDAKRRMSSLIEDVGVGISFDALDEDDQQAIDMLTGTGSGVAFSITSRPDGGDASGLWAEAQRLAISLISERRSTPLSVTPKSFETIQWPNDYDTRVRKCRLGRILYAIAQLPNYDKLCVALVESGIESVHDDRADRCIEAILRVVVLPWDCVPGLLYARPRPSGLGESEDAEKALGVLEALS
jgi:hypothetical protein